jgi:uncharacterized protein YbjT (DUF2867 family)
MPAVPSLAVAGSTGHLGGRVASLLAAAGVPQRLLVRDLSRAPSLPGADPVRFSYADGALAERALDGVDVLFMVSASEAEDRLAQHLTFVDAAVRAGVGHIVYTSFFGAAPDAVFTLARDHWATEEHIRHSGLAATFLRDNFYIDFFPSLVGTDGAIRGPAGEGAVAAVTRADVARCAVEILRNPLDHAGSSYDLTGPGELTLAAAARLLSESTGRAVAYVNETVAEAYASRAGYGAPPWQLDAWVSTYSAIAAGELAGPTTAVRDLTGTEPQSLAGFLRQ